MQELRRGVMIKNNLENNINHLTENEVTAISLLQDKIEQLNNENFK